MGNKAIEVVEKIVYKEGSLPFQTVSAEDINRLSQAELETHLTLVYKCLQKTMVAAQATAPTIASSNALFDRIQALNYLYGIAPSAEVRLYNRGCFILSLSRAACIALKLHKISNSFFEYKIYHR